MTQAQEFATVSTVDLAETPQFLKVMATVALDQKEGEEQHRLLVALASHIVGRSPDVRWKNADGFEAVGSIQLPCATNTQPHVVEFETDEALLEKHRKERPSFDWSPYQGADGLIYFTDKRLAYQFLRDVAQHCKKLAFFMAVGPDGQIADPLIEYLRMVEFSQRLLAELIEFGQTRSYMHISVSDA